MEEQLELFVVRSRDGKYFRAKGFGGAGNSWVDSIKKAKVYPRIGPARTQVTFWASHYPEFGTPEIVVLVTSVSKVLKEEDRVKNSIKSREKKELESKIRTAKWELEKAQSRVKELENEKAQKNVESKLKEVTSLEEKYKTLTKK